ncbi:uncharacterized protein LY89DRAFT_53649 [Mollisia scopiformis]|uniref:Glycosyl transferase family 1 domain-containing protein n=1 Tax=Mollisia scopiformis TaxID=149040 RepID=A0A194XCG8_MOLSC|nr:uncharacterized protein LY89DRAFT_53649 [Mollisia scopiformis]KUJ17442.1 hypothetical protein LY89DRAFT_53649 [Mollisia scopiformis]
MVYISGVHAEKWSQLHQHWWQLALVLLCFVSILLGFGVLAYKIVKNLYIFSTLKGLESHKLQARVSNHLQKYAASGSIKSSQKRVYVPPKSLSVYLGSFSNPVSLAQLTLLSRSDTIILDPQQQNVTVAFIALKEQLHTPRDIIGRLDLGPSRNWPTGLTGFETDQLFCLDRCVRFILKWYRDPKGASNCFTGVLLAGWEVFSRPVLHELSDVIGTFGLTVYLEISEPNFLEEPTILATDSIAGLVIRNGLIFANGERQDCFKMDSLSTTVKAFVSQACLRDFNVFLWETYDDNASPSNAVLQRTFAWCNFYSVVPWIGCRTSLMDLSTDPVLYEPMKAFTWLKDPEVVKLQDAWKNRNVVQTSGHYNFDSKRLNEIIPSLETAMNECSCNHPLAKGKSAVHFAIPKDANWFTSNISTGDAIGVSSTGEGYDALGCFPLGVEVSAEDFRDVVSVQNHLQSLGVLDMVSSLDLHKLGSVFANFYSANRLSSSTQPASSLVREAVLDLATILASSTHDDIGEIRLSLGLQSGFSRTAKRYFWAVYHVHPSRTLVDIYISKDVVDLPAALLHTFLSSRGISRRECLAAETAFAVWNHSAHPTHEISPRLAQDLRALTPEDALALLQRLSFNPSHKIDPLINTMKSMITKSLLDIPTWNQLQTISSVKYLNGDITIGELLRSRLAWHCQAKNPHPNLGVAIALSMEIQEALVQALRHRDRNNIQTIVEAVGNMLEFSSTSAVGGLLALAFFCTMKKLAFEEVYFEVTDRNPLFNDQADQSAAFAELFALGSRCESYFDVTPSQFGELLSTKYRSHYSTHQPPMFRETQIALSSAYAEAQIDIDLNYRPTGMPAYKRFTFLNVFAIPALIDILLLTTTGHGLYLSGTNGRGYFFMTQVEQHSATTALMISLLLSGAIGTWITCGGIYYLASMAFSAMNYFVLTRLIGGFAFTLIVGLFGFIVFASTTSVYAGLVFFLYLVVLTSYLSLLAALANYQFPGSSFHSGRATIIFCVPILFVSPITTIFVPNHDITIYLSVLYSFVSLLMLGVMRVGANWVTWFQDIVLLTDEELRSWYMDTQDSSEAQRLQEMPDPAALKLAREKLLQVVLAERKRLFFLPNTKDLLVRKLAQSFDATEFLMSWHSRSTGSPRPMIFTSSWNLQTKVALSSLQKSQLGIRFHNGFLHWRQAGDEIGCTILYFIVALLDKWISLIDGGDNVGLGNADVSMTMPVGFSLAYYLIGAVLLDYNAQALHEAASRKTEEPIHTDEDIPRAVQVKSDNRRTVYWRILASNLVWHIWALAVTTVLLWLFDDSDRDTGTIVYVSYVLAYTGLLWYQYTKVFSGPRALKPLLIGATAGLIIGFALDHHFPKWVYSDIIGLGTATWTAAVLSLWAGRIVGPSEDVPPPITSQQGTYHAYSGPGSDQAWSQAELQSLYEQLSELSEKERLKVEPQSEFGRQVNLILAQCRQTELSDLAKRAFPDAETLINTSGKLFNEKVLRVALVSIDHFSEQGRTMRAISSREQDGSMVIFAACEAKRITQTQNPMESFYWDVAELIIQVAAEKLFGYSTDDALLARILWLSNNGLWSDASGPAVLETHFRAHTLENISTLSKHLQKQLLRGLCFGIDVDTEFEELPEDIRQHIVNRCLGIPDRLTEEQKEAMNSKVNRTPGLDFDKYVARRDFAAFSYARMIDLVKERTIGDSSKPLGRRSEGQSQIVLEPPSPGATIKFIDLLARAPPPKYSIYDHIVDYSGAAYHYVGKVCKYFSIALVADPEYQRELDCAFPHGKNPANLLARFVVLAMWLWVKLFQRMFLPVFLFSRRKSITTIWKNIRGMEVSIIRRRVLVRSVNGVSTGFIHSNGDRTFQVRQFRGDLLSEPTNDIDLIAINTYTKGMRLVNRVETDHGKIINEYAYAYVDVGLQTNKQLSKSNFSMVPVSRKCTAGRNEFHDISYTKKGQIDSGSYTKDGNLIRFKYHYQQSDKYIGGLLRAEFVLPHLSCMVSWCAPPRKAAERLDTWIPHSQVIEATFVVGPDVWESRFIYDHKFDHPNILTTLNGRQKVDTPDFILHDHLDLLKKPEHVLFLDDNPLFGFKSISSNPIAKLFRTNTRRYPISTSQSRSLLWKTWKDNPKFDGVIVRWLDERLLRREPILKPYWRNRDFCNLQAAEAYLDSHRDTVTATVDLDNSISGWTPLAIKLKDLYSFGSGGDACSNTRSKAVAEDEDGKALHVIAIDTGTWPNEGGGVSACRSDVINNLRTIKWHMVAESANDFGLPKRQIERNVHSLKVVPLWGLDLLTPTHGLFSNRLESEIDHVATHITRLDIQRTFIPILAALVRGARALEFTMRDAKQVTRALVNLNAYFKDSKNWTAVWKSDVVKSAWRELWLSKSTANVRPSSQWLKTEHPTLGQLDQGLELWSRYLFIFSIPIPEKMPPVFQASHHSVSASYGIVCKIKRGCTLQIWDHAISWRETNLYLSSVLCPLSPFTRNSLLGLMRMTSVLTLHHADTILPCADFFNPGWEVEIGTCQGKIENRVAFRRKIDPVVNGITNMERFAPVKDIKTKTPTVTMLSHVWYAKDIKTALLAADIIINEWGFKDYRLEIYGALDKDPPYTANCQEIITTKSLRHQVSMMGEANPIHVLERTWVFLNSSISEGLPLALGEAALTGAPVVCTDVGASLRVLTDPSDGSCYSAVVAPNDARALARAQISVLALLGEWNQYSDATACSTSTTDFSFPESPAPDDITRITRRMYEQSNARRKLGMRAREIVQKSFSGERYLREHEQMLWIGKSKRDMYLPVNERPSARTMSSVPGMIMNVDSNVALLRSNARKPSLQFTEQSTNTSSSMPSLAYEGSSLRPTSILTDRVPSGFGQVVFGDEKWVKKPQAAVTSGLIPGQLRRESRKIGSGSGDSMV